MTDKFKISDYIRDNKPKLYARMERFYQDRPMPGKLKLRTVDLSITGKCNLECKHCYASSYPDYADVALEHWGRAIAEAKQLGAFHFVIQGGEPLVDPERLEAILDFVGPDESFINLVTNGVLASEELLKWLKAKGVDKICTSLDSGIPAEHDANRLYEGSHQKAVETLFKARELGFQVSFSATISRDNIYSEGIQKLFQFSLDNRVRMDIQVAAPVGNWCGRTDLVITPEETEYLYNKMTTNAVEDASGQVYLFNRDVYSKYGQSGCPALKNFISISPKGEILPCTFLHMSMGNITKDSLLEVLPEAMQIPYFSEYSETCLCGEHNEFIERYLIPAARSVVDGKGFMHVREVFNEFF